MRRKEDHMRCLWHLALDVWHSPMLLDYAAMRPISDACILIPKQRYQSRMVTQVREAPDLMCTELGGLTKGLQAPLNTVCASVQHPASIIFHSELDVCHASTWYTLACLKVRTEITTHIVVCVMTSQHPHHHAHHVLTTRSSLCCSGMAPLEMQHQPQAPLQCRQAADPVYAKLWKSYASDV